VYLGNDLWWDNSYWAEPEERGVPREAMIQNLLSDRPDGFNIVQLHAWQVYKERKMYRLYMEYCEHGDLEGLITNHQRLAMSVPKNQSGTTLDLCVLLLSSGVYIALPCLLTTSSQIPDAAMWSIFEALVSAACFLRDGCVPGGTPPVEWRGPIYHRDIKPPNGLCIPA
jgi:serine/threonine protein kinase